MIIETFILWGYRKLSCAWNGVELSRRSAGDFIPRYFTFSMRPDRPRFITTSSPLPIRSKAPRQNSVRLHCVMYLLASSFTHFLGFYTHAILLRPDRHRFHYRTINTQHLRSAMTRIDCCISFLWSRRWYSTTSRVLSIPLPPLYSLFV